MIERGNQLVLVFQNTAATLERNYLRSSYDRVSIASGHNNNNNNNNNNDDDILGCLCSKNCRRDTFLKNRQILFMKRNYRNYKKQSPLRVCLIITTSI